MIQKHILILHPDPREAEALSSLLSTLGLVSTSTSLEAALARLETQDFQVAVVDSSLADYRTLKGFFKRSTSLVVTASPEKPVEAILKSWPPGRFVEYSPPPLPGQDATAFLRLVSLAAEHSQLKADVESLTSSAEIGDIRLKEVYAEIKELKNLINESVVKELEKRIAIEAKYIWFQKERQKMEKTLRKLYMANDVSSLLDIVYDAKDLVRASGISIYILEKNEALGKYLKPLVWDDAFLSHYDFSKYIALLESQDFAATVARFGHELNLSELTFDKRMTSRYKEQLKKPLQNLLAVPIMHNREVVGVLEVYNKLVKDEIRKEGFTAEDQQILRGLSEHIAIAMTKLNLIQYDALTGLLRPDPFFEKLLQKINSQSKRRRGEGAYAVVMGDVDWFKNYNDRNGHEAGNRLLRELAQVLKLSIREEDLLCRYGGEEFLFFLSGVKNMDEACLLTERIRKNVEEHYFEFQEFQPRQNLTMSFGVTLLPREKLESPGPLTREDLKKLANEADVALSEAKGKRLSLLKLGEKNSHAATKNKVCFYNHDEIDREKKAPGVKLYKEKFLHERRKFERFYASTILIYRDDDAYRVARTINLSLGGIKLRTATKLPDEKTLDLILVLDDQASHLKGEVVYSERVEAETSFYTAGLKFKDLTFADRETLEDFCSLLSRKEPCLC